MITFADPLTPLPAHPMPLSWNEIKSRALAFSKEWELESSEDAEAKSFWDGFTLLNQVEHGQY